MSTYLGEFEQLVLLAILRLGKDASGSAIREDVQDGSGRTGSARRTPAEDFLP